MIASWLLMGKVARQVLLASIQSGLYGQVWAEEAAAPKQNMLAPGQKIWGEAKPNRENKRVQTATASN